MEEGLLSCRFLLIYSADQCEIGRVEIHYFSIRSADQDPDVPEDVDPSLCVPPLLRPVERQSSRGIDFNEITYLYVRTVHVDLLTVKPSGVVVEADNDRSP